MPLQGEAYAFVYSLNYDYLFGKHFRGGQQLAGNDRLKFFPTETSLPGKSTSTLGACTDWYSLETGQYITTTGDCGTMPDTGGTYNDPGTYGGTGGSGGGSTTSYPYGTTAEGTWSTTVTTDTQRNVPPADCSSWMFAKVGPNGYMACGVRDVRIDILCEWADATGRLRIEYWNFGFDKYNLYFEMPPSYSPGQAATICAELKDEAETYIENKYGSSEPANADVIANDFYSYLSRALFAVGGRLTKSANYANTPVRTYQETILPNNGGCF